MKLIVAIIRPERLEAVQAALHESDVYLMTVTDVRGCGRQRGLTEVYRGTEFQVRLLPKLKLEIAVNDAFVEAAIEAIVHSARSGDTGQIGDGKIFVLSMDDCVRIRTGERGGEAIGPRLRDKLQISDCRSQIEMRSSFGISICNLKSAMEAPELSGNW